MIIYQSLPMTKMDFIRATFTINNLIDVNQFDLNEILLNRISKCENTFL